jgi:hypothetical protein
MGFLIVDSHPAHKVKMVARFVESVKDRFRKSAVWRPPRRSLSNRER